MTAFPELPGRRGQPLSLQTGSYRYRRSGYLHRTLPGAGGTVASIIAYNEAKRWDKNPDRFGKGCLDGVMIPECANNACVGGALVPLMALGIPGSSSAAVMVGGLLAQGLTPGPAMFLNNSGIAYTFISSLFIANVFMIAVGYIIARVCTKILDVPKPSPCLRLHPVLHRQHIRCAAPCSTCWCF